MTKPNRFIFHSDYASFKNETGEVELSVTVPANLVIAANGSFLDSDTATLGTKGSSIWCRGSSSKESSGAYYVTPTLVTERFFTINDGSGNQNLLRIIAYVSRPSSTEVKLQVQTENFNPFESITGPGTAETFTFQIQTYKSPLAE